MSQRALAAKLSPQKNGLPVSHQTIANWESGRSRIPDARLAELAQFFGVTRAHLMGWDDDEPKPKLRRVK